jgi:hypothetical protein
MDADFTTHLRNFIIPSTASFITLDLGGGTWFVRLGGWIGNKTRGKITWTSTYGPLHIASSKPIVPLPPGRVPAIHANAIIEGVRFNLSTAAPKYVIWDHHTNSAFPANGLASYYFFDSGNLQLDCAGLEGGIKTTVRITHMSTDPAMLPVDRVKTCIAYTIAMNKVPLRRRGDGTMANIIQRNSAEVIKREAAERGHLRFTSHTDYLKYTAAMAADKRT